MSTVIFFSPVDYLYNALARPETAREHYYREHSRVRFERRMLRNKFCDNAAFTRQPRVPLQGEAGTLEGLRFIESKTVR